MSPAPDPVDQRSKQRSNRSQMSQSRFGVKIKFEVKIRPNQVRLGHFACGSCKGMESAFFERQAPGQCSLLWDSLQMEEWKRKQINGGAIGYISEEKRAEQKAEVVGCPRCNLCIGSRSPNPGVEGGSHSGRERCHVTSLKDDSVLVRNVCKTYKQSNGSPSLTRVSLSPLRSTLRLANIILNHTCRRIGTLAQLVAIQMLKARPNGSVDVVILTGEAVLTRITERVELVAPVAPEVEPLGGRVGAGG